MLAVRADGDALDFGIEFGVIAGTRRVVHDPLEVAEDPTGLDVLQADDPDTSTGEDLGVLVPLAPVHGLHGLEKVALDLSDLDLEASDLSLTIRHARLNLSDLVHLLGPDDRILGHVVRDHHDHQIVAHDGVLDAVDLDHHAPVLDFQFIDRFRAIAAHLILLSPLVAALLVHRNPLETIKLKTINSLDSKGHNKGTQSRTVKKQNRKNLQFRRIIMTLCSIYVNTP